MSILKHIKQKGYSIRKFHDITDIPPAAIYKIESGEYGCHIFDTLTKSSSVLDVSPLNIIKNEFTNSSKKSYQKELSNMKSRISELEKEIKILKKNTYTEDCVEVKYYNFLDLKSGSDFDSHEGGTLILDKKFFKRHTDKPWINENLLAVKVRDRSMEPILQVNSLCVINTKIDDPITYGERLYLIKLKNRYLIRRLRYIDDNTENKEQLKPGYLYAIPEVSKTGKCNYPTLSIKWDCNGGEKNKKWTILGSVILNSERFL